MKADKNMLLITSYWGQNDTVKMIPTSIDCPYSEVIYDPSTSLLVVISKIQKENFQMVSKLDEDGNEILAKKPRQNGKNIKEIRTKMNTLQEYYIIEQEEQIAFIEMFAVNALSFDFRKYMVVDKPNELQQMAEKAAKNAKAEKSNLKLVDKKGKPLVKK